MISPSPPDFHLAGLKVVSRRILGAVRVPIGYKRFLTPAMRVSLISFFVIPYFSTNGDTSMALREKSALFYRWPGARS
jgi:hypothetical protein